MIAKKLVFLKKDIDSTINVIMHSDITMFEKIQRIAFPKMSKVTFDQVIDKSQIGIVESLAREIWQEVYTPIIGKDQVQYMLDNFQSEKAITAQIDKGSLYYLIKDNDTYAGYFGVVLKDDYCFLSKLYINSDNRGKGFGKQAINFIEKLTRENGLLKINLTVNKNNINAISSYQKIGFKIVKPIVQDIGNGFVMDDYLMEKYL